ncbi:hypothetical protein [Roseibium polysiphoniae]|uniref:hypothetical protein n=1 Tax=Roseibium polysiphoniae TaxID=2571221 RepID=UPI00259903E5|nr:hypothetical protein [uncultured Roseibium sp.]
MKKIALFTAPLLASAGSALAHPSALQHAHPHTDASGLFTIETLVIVALGLSLAGAIAWARRGKEGGK